MSRGLYRLDEYRDNCGFGLIAHIGGHASHNLLQKAIEALTCMTHRGGIAADGKTGDGCGLLMQIPDTFFRDITQTQHHTSLPDRYAVGAIMFSNRREEREKARAVIESEMARENLEVLAWREVPTNSQCLGEIALRTLPVLEHLFVGAPADLDEKQFDARLFVARRRTEKRLCTNKGFYIASLSARVICYKGLMMPVDLPNFYPDLSDPRLKTAICVFHQRFSTNTLPEWPLAQPFRMLAHNGEINTILGNRNWAVARTAKFDTPLLPELNELAPLVNREGSDSSSLDNMLELLVTGGVPLHQAVRMLIPPAWHNVDDMDAEQRAFFAYQSMHMEPWDGPAGLVMTDGRYAVCALDRNGLRPSRWVLTNDDIITVASEVGVYDYQPETVVAKGRLGPGDMLSVDIVRGQVETRDQIDRRLAAAKPYRQWLKQGAKTIASTMDLDGLEAEGTLSPQLIKRYMKMYGVSLEERDQVLAPLAEGAQEAVASMGDDSPMAVLSEQCRSVFDYFRQQFAQVTNPPIDPLREGITMSLSTQLGKEHNVFDQTVDHAQRINLNSPVLSPRKYFALKNNDIAGFQARKFALAYKPAETDLKSAIHKLCAEIEAAVRDDVTICILSDYKIEVGEIPVQAVFAVGAVHNHLIARGLRCDTNLIVSTGAARDPHQIATLIGCGATAVYPYLSYHLLHEMCESGELLVDLDTAFKHYRRGINKGLMKILSKMGISTIASYRGAMLYEAVGFADEIIDLCFPGLISRIQGSGFADFQKDQELLAQATWKDRQPISPGGLFKYIHGQEYHAFNPDVVEALHKVVRSGDYADWRAYANLVNGRPVATLRDLMKVKFGGSPIALDEVEPIEKIITRFDSAGMSLGALSPEAHEALAEALNSLGGRSNSGEGGEDPRRYGTKKTSKIKQVASGRFGVTPHYLVNAEVIQIKIAQGAKPGEGGQLPGGKVNKLIASLRYSVPGVTLISPPPHHDIYSIEDLAQLIFDLKQVNPQALVSVKLVSRPGVGTIAAGVAKAYADLITISGYDGGTAASPLTSIRYAGSPWELGLAETHQTLKANDLRDKIRVQADGGLKTGLDVIKAAILGAESFGFGTAPMVALGCKYLRICHLNNCATGVATQDARLRENHFHGTVENARNFFRFVAEEVREYLAALGVPTLEALIGRVDLLEVVPGKTERHGKLDLSAILHTDELLESKPQHCLVARNAPFDKGELAERMVADMLPAIEAASGGEFHYRVSNCDRTLGARLSGEIARRHGNRGMARAPLKVCLEGVAGQSLGAWNAGGLELYLRGDANDYVGKGMAGGKIVIAPPPGSSFASHETPIMGNTCLYGATGGRLFAAGRAGERFAVRNSGATAVIEGAGDHCCEYMTGGVTVILGSTGYNFGAGMTGGFAYVLDENRQFYDRVNSELVDVQHITQEAEEHQREFLLGLITEFVNETASQRGQTVLENFDALINKFWLVKPKSASLAGLFENTRARPE